MARTQVTQVKVTDDVTGIAYLGIMGDGSDVDSVRAYRVTVTPLNDAGNVINAEKWTKDVDMHVNTYQAVTAFIGASDAVLIFRIIVQTMFGVTATATDALWSYVTTGAVSALNALGIKSGNASKGNGSKPTLVKCAKMWHVENGTMPLASNGKLPMGALTQDKLNEYVAATGATTDNPYGNWTPKADSTTTTETE